MSTRFIASLHAVKLQRDDFAVEQGYTTVPAAQTVRHACASTCAWPVNRVDFLGEKLGKNFLRRSSLPRELADKYSPFGVVIFSRAETSTPAFLAKAWAAGVGSPFLNATVAEGPVICS